MSTRKQRKSKRSNNAVGPSASATSYSGPVKPVRDMEDSMRTLPFIQTGFLSSSASGTLQFYVQNDANNAWSLNGGSTAALNDFTDAAALYLQYRVLSILFEYCPASEGANMIVGGTSLSLAPLEVVRTHQDSPLGVLTSYANALEYANVEQRPLNKRFSFTMRMNGPGESEWVDTSGGTPTDYYGMSMYATGLSNTANYGRYKLTTVIQFRVRA
jgi:hypothetical protein